MRVLHLSSLWPPHVIGGAELYAARLAAEQAAVGHTVGAVTRGVSGTNIVAEVPAWPYRLDQFHGAPTWRRWAFHARDVYDPVGGRVIRRAIERFRPDVVHTHAVAGLSAAALAVPRRMTVPHVHTLHDHWLLCRRTTLVAKNGDRCERRCTGCALIGGSRRIVLRHRLADVVIAPSQYILDVHLQDWPEFTESAVVIRHPADLPTDGKARGVFRSNREVNNGPVAFGFLGHLAPAKGLPTLLAAFRLLPEGSATLRVAGTGSLAIELEREPPPVYFDGWVGGALREQFFAAIDCLVVPSETPEAAGMVVGEAQGRGVSVIAAAIGALPEYLDPASHDRLFPAGDVDALHRALRGFLAESAPRQPSGRSGPTWAEHVAAVAEVYDRVVGARR